MRCWLFIGIAGLLSFLCSSLPAAAEAPSENAADLYIKCIQRFKKPGAAVWKQIQDLSFAPTATLSPEAIAFIEEQRRNSLIADIEAATKVKNCDWKLDYSKGVAMETPYLGEMKQLTQLLFADGALAATREDCETAINRNLAVWRMGHHRGMGKTTLEFIVSHSLASIGSEGLRRTLGTCVIDSAGLASLKKELSAESYWLPSLKDSILLDKKTMLLEVSRLKSWRSENTETAKEQKEQSRKFSKVSDPNDSARIASFIQYIENCYDPILAALDKPYSAAIAEIKQTDEKLKKDLGANNDVAFPPPPPIWGKIYSISTRIRTQGNALLTALDVYAAARQTGQLPKELPNTSYVDLFSGKPFIYEITPNGFRLRCRQEDITDKNKKTWEWEYTVKKP